MMDSPSLEMLKKGLDMTLSLVDKVVLVRLAMISKLFSKLVDSVIYVHS